jgi:tRNA 2-thiouridine synthesizing protein A
VNPGPSPQQDVPLIEVDARGLRCPLPVIRLAEAAREAAAGTVIVVLAGDPAARHDIPAWCRMRDHELVEMTEVREATWASEPSGSDAAVETNQADEAEVAATGPAYLRFVVLIRTQLSKAAGSGNGSERSSRAR